MFLILVQKILIIATVSSIEPTMGVGMAIVNLFLSIALIVVVVDLIVLFLFAVPVYL